MQLRPGGGGYESGPNGNQNYRDGMYNPGQLLGRVGKSGKIFSVGEHYRGTPGESGKLYLRVHPSPWGNQMLGTYSAKVMVGEGAVGRTPITTQPKKTQVTDEQKKADSIPKLR
jgi:hypothetical protein